MEGERGGRWITWSVLGFIAYELWKRSGGGAAGSSDEAPMVSDVPSSSQVSNSTWVQQLGSTYYGDAYNYNGTTGSPFCGSPQGSADVSTPAPPFPAVTPGNAQSGAWLDVGAAIESGNPYAPIIW